MLTEASWSKDHFAWKTQKRSKFPKMCWKSITHLLCNYLGVLSSSSVCLPFVRFRQNWAFSNQIFWRQTIILLPLSFFHWIGDKPFLAGSPSPCPGCWGPSYQSTIISNASPSFMRLSTPSPSPATPHHRRPAKPKTHQNGRTLDCVKNDQKRSAARPPRENRLMTRLIWFIDLGVWANEGALWTVCYYLKTRCDLIGYRDNAAPQATLVTVTSALGTRAQQQPQLPGAGKDNLFPPARARIQPGTQFGAKNLLPSPEHRAWLAR